MRFSLLSAAFAAPLLAVSALAGEPGDGKADTSAKTEQSEAAGDAAEAPEPKAEDKRVCRHIRADASSRRKTKVCMTTDEWREFNNRR